MLISEIFKSIDGEGITAGYPAVFIRTYGCNLRCSYCDTKYALTGDEYRVMTPEEILEEVQTRFPGSTRITLTGGEPLLQKDAPLLLKILLEHDYFVNIETNGAIDLDGLFMKIHGAGNGFAVNLGRLIITMDWKSPSSGCEGMMVEHNINHLSKFDVLKFVVGSKEDLDAMKAVLDTHHTNCYVFVSPIFGQIEPKEIVQYLLDNHLEWVRVQLQLHKFIWPPEMRGV